MNGHDGLRLGCPPDGACGSLRVDKPIWMASWLSKTRALEGRVAAQDKPRVVRRVSIYARIPNIADDVTGVVRLMRCVLWAPVRRNVRTASCRALHPVSTLVPMRMIAAGVAKFVLENWRVWVAHVRAAFMKVFVLATPAPNC